MKSYSGIRERIGTRAALHYLRDYHEQRIDVAGTWDDAIYTMNSYGHDESEVAAHARLMDECGSDFVRYAWRFPKQKTAGSPR